MVHLNMCDHNKLEEILQHPDQFYKTPDEVVKDPGLNADQKEQILENWAEDEKALLNAEFENMQTDDTRENECSAETLQKIHNAKGKLD